MAARAKLVVWFSEVDKHDVALVGGKGANLGEMVRNRFPVPDGFIVTSEAYYEFIKENNLQRHITDLLAWVDYGDQSSLDKVSQQIKQTIIEGRVSEQLKHEILVSYKKLSGVLRPALVAVRSSTTVEDTVNASFAGQHETYLNVSGEANVLLKIKEGWASLFDARAIFYRHEKHFDHFKIGIAIPVQKMVESEKSGVMFTLDPVNNDRKKIVIEAVFGLGEMMVQGEVTPDHYEVSKTTLGIIEKNIATQDIYLTKKGSKNVKVRITPKHRNIQKITNAQIIELADIGRRLEKHYFFPQDIEWAIEKKNIYVVQTRPVTTTGRIKKEPIDNEVHKPILKGDPVSPGIISGPVRILRSVKEMHKLITGEILVTPEISPDFVLAMKKASAIITDKGGRTSHAAIVSREIGIPAIVGTEMATKLLKDGMIITVNGGKGEIYKGGFANKTTIPEGFPGMVKTATKVYVTLAEPEFASRVARRNVDGVGLLRAEFIMDHIGMHPKKMIREGKRKVYIEKLTEGMEAFCKAFSPRPVIYRASNFKTDEYRTLVGGKEYEPVEPNPALGYRGAFRYIHDPEVFLLELEAIKHIRNKRGLKNLWLMISFVRSVRELREIKRIITAAGLYRTPTFKLWMMAEVPSNVILLEDFIKAGIDGVSIGSDTLTMLFSGTDRDNSDVATAFNEQDEIALWAFERVIRTAQRHKIPTTLCGHAVSLYPSLLEKLVEWGISGVSVSPDVIDSTRTLIAEVEKKMIT